MFCLTASVTSASRMMFAFSRDRAVPGHQTWRKVGASRVPTNAVLAIGVLSFALMIPTYWNAYTGYLVGTSIAVIGLYIAFILPVILRYRKKDDWEPGAWSLGADYGPPLPEVAFRLHDRATAAAGGVARGRARRPQGRAFRARRPRSPRARATRAGAHGRVARLGAVGGAAGATAARARPGRRD